MGKIIKYGVGALLGVFAFIFILELFGVGMFKFFAPMKENIRREVFENTKSYVHGKTQDLSKYYGEYNKSESTEEKAAIANLIRMQFADFDADMLQSPQLKRFLKQIRGY